MKTIIAGSREFKDSRILEQAIRESRFVISEVFCGEARGADYLGKKWAEANGILVRPFPADWDNLTHPDARIKVDRNGKQYDANAGHRRNQQMADQADALIAVWDGSSPGTKSMIAKAKAKGLFTYVHVY